MEKMRFHWEKPDGKTGTFTVTASSVDKCIEIAEEELKGDEHQITDYYSI